MNRKGPWTRKLLFWRKHRWFWTVRQRFFRTRAGKGLQSAVYRLSRRRYPLEASPCLSLSTSRTQKPFSASRCAIATLEMVFATPPFKLITDKTRISILSVPFCPSRR